MLLGLAYALESQLVQTRSVETLVSELGMQSLQQQHFKIYEAIHVYKWFRMIRYTTPNDRIVGVEGELACDKIIGKREELPFCATIDRPIRLAWQYISTHSRDCSSSPFKSSLPLIRQSCRR
mmetsp:Transcript_31037/g.72892  ORF Transcript_31037/g.72892 Transcript_31037/m.72892 type:complete len:122 (-) Transcript_31037:354-719(-)